MHSPRNLGIVLDEVLSQNFGLWPLTTSYPQSRPKFVVVSLPMFSSAKAARANAKALILPVCFRAKASQFVGFTFSMLCIAP